MTESHDFFLPGGPQGVLLVHVDKPPPQVQSLPWSELVATRTTDAVAKSVAMIEPKTVGKFLFTSGSTGEPVAIEKRLRQLDAEVQKWGEELCERSPTAIAIAKRSFNMDTAHQSGIAGMGMYALKLYYDTEESREGVKALQEKRKPDFRKYAK